MILDTYETAYFLSVLQKKVFLGVFLL